MLSFQLFLLSLTSLAAIALVEKIAFLLYHSALHEGYGAGAILTTLVEGMRFDLAVSGLFAFAAFFTALPLSYWRRWPLNRSLALTTTVMAIALIALQGTDLLYFGETGRHLGYELRDLFNAAGGLASSALFSYPIEVFLQVVFMIIASRAIHLLMSRPRWCCTTPKLVTLSLPSTAVLLCSAILVRGGLAPVPLEPVQSNNIREPALAPLALNGAYNALYFTIVPYGIHSAFSDIPDAETWRAIETLYPPTSAPPALLRGANVVVVLLESWSAAYLPPFTNASDVTPVFNGLRARGVSSDVMVASGGRTTEGMFATFCSWPNPLGGTVARTHLQGFRYQCLPHLLADAGYDSAFFQGTLENTSGTGSFARLLGFHHSFGKESMPAPRYPHNSWGAHDPDIYDFAATTAATLQEPYLIGINTNTTHDLNLPDGVAPLREGEDVTSRYLSTLHFADGALQEFLAKWQTQPRRYPTLFVFVADHTGHAPPGNLQHYLIPYVVYAPGQLEPRHLERSVSQRDLAPTILDLLGLPVPDHFSGHSLIRPLPDTAQFADYFREGTYGWVSPQGIIEFPLNDLAKLNCMSLQTTPLAIANRACGEHDLRQHEQAFSFAHLTQSLLFSGRIGEFVMPMTPSTAQMSAVPYAAYDDPAHRK